MVEATLEQFGSIDVLVNNAGINLRLPLVPLPNGVPDWLRVPRAADSSITDDEWQRVQSVNVSGVMYGCRAVAPHMLARSRGKIINVSSVQGKTAVPYYSAYAVSKAAVNMLTRVLALEWAQHGIQVNALCPVPTRRTWRVISGPIRQRPKEPRRRYPWDDPVISASWGFWRPTWQALHPIT